MKFYPIDWRADPRLRMCSLAARGMWIDLISYMHEGQPYGHLTIDGVAPSLDDIAALVARPRAEVRRAVAELEARQVFSRNADGAMFSRRMVRDKAKADMDSENGKGGGNPKLTTPDNMGVNPPHKAQILDARIQKLEKKEDISAVAVATRRHAGNHFEDFWKSFPKRSGANPKHPAEKQFLAAIKSGVSPEILIDGARRYRAEQQALGKIGTEHVARALTWLNQHRWIDYQPPQITATNGWQPGMPTDEELRRKFSNGA